MSWLVVSKIVPPLQIGEPPSYASILHESQDDPPVCWAIRLHDRTIGWAANRLTRRDDGMADLHSRVYLGEFPWSELAPGWLSSVLKPMFRKFDDLDIDKKTQLVIDPLGRLVEFESRVRVGHLTDAIRVQGQVEGSTLRLSMQSGEFPYKMVCYLPPNALMGDELSPQVRMPGLRVGQTWTVPLYSPFRSPSQPLEILQAVVERDDRLTWGGRSVPCRVIVYRGDPGAGVANDEARGRMWVDHGGVVLRQEVAVLHSRIHFVRLADDEARRLWQALGSDCAAPLSRRQASGLLHHVTSDSP